VLTRAPEGCARIRPGRARRGIDGRPGGCDEQCRPSRLLIHQKEFFGKACGTHRGWSSDGRGRLVGAVRTAEAKCSAHPMLTEEIVAVDLDLPYEDEPLFGVVARYLHDMRVSVGSTTLRRIFGYFPSLPVGVTYGLEHVAVECQHVWPWDADQIAERMTLYPYFASLLPEEAAIRLLEEMLTRPVNHRPMRLEMPGKLRYCDECLASDRAMGQAQYWRREHLLPNVLICPRHERWLVEVELGRNRTTLPWPTPQSVVGCGKEVNLHVTASQHDACLRIAQISASLLHSKVSVVPETLLSHFRNSARAGGFAHGIDKIRGRDFMHALVQHFGESFLRHIGLMLRTYSGWLQFAMTRGLSVGLVARTVVLAEFLSSLPTSDCDDAWPFCPIVQSMHGAFHPVSLRQSLGNGYLAKCSCGVAFTYKGVVNGFPQNPKPTRYDFLAEEVKRLRDAGWSKLAIATELQISHSTVRRLCRQSHLAGNGVLSPEARNAMSKEWQQLKKTWGSASAASRVNPSLYLRMLRYSREYL